MPKPCRGEVILRGGDDAWRGGRVSRGSATDCLEGRFTQGVNLTDFLLKAGLLIVRLQLDVSGFGLVLAYAAGKRHVSRPEL